LDLLSIEMKGILPWLGRRAHRVGTRDFLLPFDALVGPVQNFFFLAVHYFNFCVPIAQQPGQSVVQGRLSRNVCLRQRHSCKQVEVLSLNPSNVQIQD
jgi:hypothetical protein